jgi:hypothetical protein
MEDREEGTEPEVRVVIRLQGSDRFPATLLLETVERVSWAIADAEARQIDELQAEFPEIPSHIFAELKEQLPGLRGRALNIETASTGSIELVGRAAGLVAAWLLVKLKDKLGDEILERIIAFFRRGLRTKVLDIVNRIWDYLRKATFRVEVASERRDDLGFVIFVTANASYPDAAIPTEAETLGKWGRQSEASDGPGRET